MGSLRRYRAKKWQWLGKSDVSASAGGAFEVFAADFQDKFETPYTFVVAVDIESGRIWPLDDLDASSRELIETWVLSSAGKSPKSAAVPRQFEKLVYTIWLGEVDVPPHPKMPLSKTPRLLLGSSAHDPLAQINKLNSGAVGGSGFTTRHPITPRLDLLDALPKAVRGEPAYSKLAHMRTRKAKIRDYLRDDGFIVDLSNGNTVYTIYVINLSDAVGPRVGPHRWVYVGQTSKTPEERLQEHLAGIHSSKWVRNFGEDLNYRLYSNVVPQVRFRQDAQELKPS